MMGWCIGNFGWSNAEIAKATARFRGPDYVYPGYSYKRWSELARLLASIAPGKLVKSLRATGGSEAVELALQAAMVHTGRQGFLSLQDSYHGNTLGTMSIGASENWEHCPNLLPHCAKINEPRDGNALDKIERRLKKRQTAAFIMEPISINLGVLIPEKAFMTELQRLCRRYGTLLVMDEVATGFGRTGKLFASEHFDLQPDIMCIAKAVTGGYAGLGAMLATSTVAQSMEENGNFYSTYGWHPRSVDAAIAAIRYLTKHKRALLANVVKIGDYFQMRLARIRFQHSATIHAKGLAIAVDLSGGEYAETLQDKCRRNGLLISKEDSTLLLLPALTIDDPVAKQGLDILEDCA